MTSDSAPEAAAVTLLAVGDNQTKAGPPVRARDTDAGDVLTYRLSDTDAGSGHSGLFSIDSGSGQISRWSDTPAGVYKVTVSVSDDGFDADATDDASVAVVVHVTSAGLYPRWSQAASVTADDGSANDWFGVSVDVSGGVLVVGAPFGDSSTTVGATDSWGPGAAYVFNASTGAQLARLDSPNAANGGWFGSQVQIVGDAVFVSAPREAVGTVADAGRVYVFTKPAGGWADTSTAAATLTPGATSVPNDANNGLGGARFGYGLAVSDDGSTLAAGAPFWQRRGDTGTDKADVTGMDSDGAVFVFAKPTAGWGNASTDTTGVVRLFGGSRLYQGSRLGETVAISDDGSVIAAAAPFYGGDRDGRLFVFTRPVTGWASTALADSPARLEASQRIPDEQVGSLGLDISGDGSVVVAGAPVEWLKDNTVRDASILGTSYGRAVVFVKPSTGWADIQGHFGELKPAVGHKYDGFGSAVAVSDSGNKIAVGNPYSRSSNYRGSVHVYTKPAAGWNADGVGDSVRVLTAATTGDSAVDTRQRYGFGGRGLAFAGEDSLVVGQHAQVPALIQGDGLSSLPVGGLYGANADQRGRTDVPQGSAYVFDLADAPPVFLEADRAPEAAAVKLLAVGDDQTLAGPPVRAHYHGDRSRLTYSLSDWSHSHASFFTIDSSTGQISRKSYTRRGVYRVRVTVSDGTETDTVGVTIHVTSPGEYPWEDTWVQARSMSASGVTSADNLGWTVDGTSDVIVAGAHGAASSTGAVYVFDARSGVQLAKLTSPNAAAGGVFGYSMAVAGDTVFAGTSAEDLGRGRIHVFTKPPTGWADTNVPTATLSPAPALGNNVWFATHFAVSDDGNTVVAGMSGLSTQTGAVVVFTKPPTGWADANSASSNAVTLHAGTRRQAGSFFGHFVEVSDDGGTIAVAATLNWVAGLGEVYMFTKEETGWAATTSSTVVPRLRVDGGFSGLRLGNLGLSLSYDGSTLVAAGPGGWSSDHSQRPGDAYGSAYVFVRPSGGWTDATETAELTAGFGHQYDLFGQGVAISGSGDRIAVGNPASRSSNYRGSVYVYTKPAGGWVGDIDGRGGGLRVLTLADADSNPKHRYAFGDRGLKFIGEDKLVVGQTGIVDALRNRDGLSSLPAGGLYGANADQSSSSNIRPGAAHLFVLRQAPPRQTVSPPPPPPPPPPDGGATGPDDETTTDPPPPPPTVFADVDEGSVHAESIEEVAALGITTGTADMTFSPSAPVTRGQMATFVARTWEAAGRECPMSGASSFDDVAAGSTHTTGIDCVSALGVAQGTAERTFSPSEPVTRAQMAAFLARAWEAAGRECPTSGASSFDDVPAGSTHADSIGCMAALGITRGTAAGTFSPSDTVTRAQMATFLARFHEALTDTA